MRKLNKKLTVAAAATAVAVAGSGLAFGWWSTTGSGTGSGATTAGVIDTLEFSQNALNDMYPGDSSQNLTVTVTNSDADQHVWVQSVMAYVTTTSAGCDGTDFLLNGAATAVDEASAVAMTWTPVELLDDESNSGDATGTIQFNNKPSNQDDCKGADVTIHYFVPALP